MRRLRSAVGSARFTQLQVMRATASVLHLWRLEASQETVNSDVRLRRARVFCRRRRVSQSLTMWCALMRCKLRWRAKGAAALTGAVRRFVTASVLCHWRRLHTKMRRDRLLQTKSQCFRAWQSEVKIHLLQAILAARWTEATWKCWRRRQVHQRTRTFGHCA